MAADGADRRHRDPQYLEGYAPAVSRGVHELFWKRRRTERLSSEAQSPGALVNNAPAAAFAGAFLGCLAALHFSGYGFVPAIASALATTLLCGPLLATRTTGLFPSEFFTAIYGGTFTGMTPVLGLLDNTPGASVMSASALFVLLSIVTGIAFCIVGEIDARSGRRLAGGYGGRSGAIATLASFLFVEAARPFGADDRFFRAAHEMPGVDPSSLALTCATCAIGLCATLLALRGRSVASAEPAHRVFIAASVAVIGLILLHVNDPGETRSLDAFYAGCFLGMSTQERLKGWTQFAFGAILLTAMLVVVRTLLPDVGGGLGFAAFVTVTVLVALGRVTTWLTNDNPVRGQSPRPATTASASGGLIPGVPVRSAIIVATSVAGLLLIGWPALPDEVASEELALDTAAGERMAEQPVPEQLALVQTKPASVDEAISSGMASGDAVHADLKALTGVSPESNVMAIWTAHEFAGAADAAAEPGRAARAEAAAPASVEAVQRGPATDEVTKPPEEDFRAFMRWRAAHPAAIDQSRAQPVRRSPNPALQTVRVTPAGLRDNSRRPSRTWGIRPAPGPSLH